MITIYKTNERKKKDKRISKKNVLPEEYGNSADDESYHSAIFTDNSLSGSPKATSNIKKLVLPRQPRQLKLRLKNTIKTLLLTNLFILIMNL